MLIFGNKVLYNPRAPAQRGPQLGEILSLFLGARVGGVDVYLGAVAGWGR
jgi:hypothetical protein